MTWLMRIGIGIAAAALGLAAGAGVALVVGGDEPAAVEVAVAGISVYDCPSGVSVGEYSPGTRVYVVGRSEPAGWLQIRDLDQPAGRLWMRVSDLELDEASLDVPVSGCGSSAIEQQTTTTTEPTTTTTEPTTTTTTAGETTTTTAPGTTTSTTVSPTTTTTLGTTTSTATTAPPPPPDETPPVISGVTANPNKIWEEDTESLSCGDVPREAALSAQVSDSGSGVALVTASWTIEGTSGSTSLTPSGSTFTGVFGPFPYLTIPEEDEDQIVSITIRARDVAGNQSTASVGVRLHSLATCFG